MSYQYSDFPNKDDFQGWEYFENINNIDKDNINADREYLVDDNKRISAQFVNIVLDSIRAIEKFVQGLSKKKPNMSDVEGVLSITHGGTGATTAANALKNFGLTATAEELNYTDGVTSNIQTQLNNKADKNHTHSDATVNSAGFMSSADKKKLDGIAEGAGQNMDNYVAKRGNDTLHLVGYSDIYLSPTSSFYIESGENEIINVSAKGMDIGGDLTVTGKISTKNIEANELRIKDVNTSNDKLVYTIHTDVSSGTGNRLDFFKIIGNDSLVKMTFKPNISKTNQISANGLIEIEGDVDIDSGNKLSVQRIDSDDSLLIDSRKDFVINASHNISLRQPNSNTPDGNDAELCIKGSASANIKGGTLVFSRNSQDILRIGEKDDADGQPVYNQFRVEGDEVHFLLNSTGSMLQATDDQVQIRHSDKAKLILGENGVQTTELYFRNLGFTGLSPERETYLKSTTVQRIVNDILNRLDALEDGSSGGGGNCEAITEAELNAMFEEIGL